MRNILLGIIVASVMSIAHVQVIAGPPGGGAGAGSSGHGGGTPGMEREGHRDRANRGFDEGTQRSREGLQRGSEHASPEADQGIDRAWEGLESDSQRGMEQEGQRRPRSR